MNESTTTPGKKYTKEYAKAPDPRHLKQLMGDLKWDGATLAKRLGVSTSGLSGWLNETQPTPFWTLLACHGLRASEKFEARTRQVWLVKVEPEKAELLGTFLRGAGVAWTKVE